ncbi:MAG TPA: pitrilysin family protein [Anaerolineaceae bacterium]|nr:pitrilysin family protein [Anaerolineaceae bacterium]
MDTILHSVLPNGLAVHLHEIHTAPIISHWLWYRAGSRNELAGLSGISHWVEHMQFKGTPAFPAGEPDKAIARLGGYWNAFTYLDWTAYYATLRAAEIDLALRLEADRMVNSLFLPKDVESERMVILSEREGSENEPLFRLGEAVQQKGFTQHPYRNEVLGSKEDLRRITREDLYGYYCQYYQPANAVLTLAGDFDARAMLARVEELYAGLPGGVTPPADVLLEAPLQGEQRVEVNGPGRTTYLQLAYRAPQASSPDFFAFAVLDSLLSGPTGLNMFGGGGISNKTSRLYRALVEQDLVVGVHGGISATIDPYLYDITLTVRPRKTVAQVLAALDDEILRVQNEAPAQAEVNRAVKQARALFAYGSENITNQAFWLGFAEMFASYPWFEGYVAALERVTPADIQRVAQEYLQPSRRVVGVYLPGSRRPK